AARAGAGCRPHRRARPPQGPRGGVRLRRNGLLGVAGRRGSARPRGRRGGGEGGRPGVGTRPAPRSLVVTAEKGTLVAAFPDQEHASEAAHALDAAGFPPDHVGLVAGNVRQAREATGGISVQGAIAGAIVGALVTVSGPSAELARARTLLERHGATAIRREDTGEAV